MGQMWLVITMTIIPLDSGHIIELRDHVMCMQYTFPKVASHSTHT